jgi:hypothetical protein
MSIWNIYACASFLFCIGISIDVDIVIGRCRKTPTCLFGSGTTFLQFWTGMWFLFRPCCLKLEVGSFLWTAWLKGSWRLLQDDEHARHNESNATVAGEAEHGAGRQHFAQVPGIDSLAAPIVGMFRLAPAHGLLLCTLPFWVACLACAAMHSHKPWKVSSLVNFAGGFGGVRSTTSTMSWGLACQIEGPFVEYWNQVVAWGSV